MDRASQTDKPRNRFPIQPPELFPGVIPPRVKAPVLAKDGEFGAAYTYAGIFTGAGFEGFPGYQYLAQLATIAEYRALAESYASEITREWIEIQSTETDNTATAEKVSELTKAITKLNLKAIISKAATHDYLFGRGQIVVDIIGQENRRHLPLVVKPGGVKKGTEIRVVNVEPMWTSPVTYNAMDALNPWFYKPQKWWLLGQQIHSDRILTITTRELPDMLKPAFNFSGMSMSQLAEPTINNWLRTRQSVADLINNFSITVLATKMSDVLQQGNDGTNLFKRLQLFTATRSNRGIMAVDKDSEELGKHDTTLAGLHELQAQAQEGMCSIGKTPSTVLLGVAPNGFGNLADGELDAWGNWISGQQEAFWRDPIKFVLDLLQICMYGVIDEDITFRFNPLKEMTKKELSEIRKSDADAAGVYIDRGVISSQEERERVARDPESGYQGLDLSQTPVLEDDEDNDEDVT